jgi:hypothetical protein
VTRVVVRLNIGLDRMAASDDPLFLGLRGPGGREFRLASTHGRPLRRGSEDVFVLAAPDDPDTNVASPALNDPAASPIELAAVRAVYLRKGLDPIPNVRGHGEMDDRVQLVSAEVELHGPGAPKPRRFVGRGPIWLGLVCGMVWDLEPADEAS